MKRIKRMRGIKKRLWSHNWRIFAGICATILAVVLALLLCIRATATATSFKFTAYALGLGSAKINDSKAKDVDPDIPGMLWTSSTTGEGSILQIVESGLAGPGTPEDPLFATVTAQTRLDITENLPAGDHDIHAGILFISEEKEEKDDMPDGADEGLGVRGFKVDADGMRTYNLNGSVDLPDFDGSKEVSGGTDYPAFDPLDPWSAPHVDESVKIDFSSQFVAAQSISVLLSKFDSKDMLDLYIERTSEPPIVLSSLQITDTSIFEQVDPGYDKLWNLKFSGIEGLELGDSVDFFEIRSTSEHFLITGVTASVPEPATLLLLGFALIGLGIGVRRRIG